ncbi:MAG TPA: YdcF family protein [Candidatus Saccharimonadales bacterium]|nr:YdcF family protein [Candidatus Saccharimonadales bacterium]
MITHPDVENAILLLGHMPDHQGRIQEGTKIRVKCAARLYCEGVAPVVIPSGWYMPKDDTLRKFREAYIMERYLHEAFGNDIKTICEPYSTSVPENLLFTQALFPNLRKLAVVTGELFEERTRLLADMVFDGEVEVAIYTCSDGLSTVANEQRLKRNLECMLGNIAPGNLKILMADPDSEGNLRSGWTAMNEKHKHTCTLHPV